MYQGYNYWFPSNNCGKQQVCVPNVHKHLRSAQATETQAHVPGRPAFTNPDALRFKDICKKPLKNPSHWHLQQSTTPGPNICSPLHWQPYQFQRKCLLAILEGREKLCEANGQAVPTSFWLPDEDMPDCSLEAEEMGISLWVFFTNYENRLFQKQNLQTGSCFVPAYIGMRSREQNLGLPFLSSEPVNVNTS